MLDLAAAEWSGAPSRGWAVFRGEVFELRKAAVSQLVPGGMFSTSQGLFRVTSATDRRPSISPRREADIV